jgi:4-amino-4-deoxy-L-arabinose transferase-like glycosyltransferase
MALFTWIGGDNEFSVRVGGLLCTLVSHVFLYLTVKRLSGNDTGLAWEVLFIFNLTLLLSGGCIIQTPDTPLLLFWTIALYGCTQVFTGGGKGWWYASGAALGLGLLSKYTMALMIPCVFTFLLVFPPHRHWLLQKEPYLATLLGALVFSPVIVWNMQHHWASPAFQFAQGFSPLREPAVLKLLEYIGGQIGVVTPLLFLLSLDLHASTLERWKPHFEEVVVLGKNRCFYRGEPLKRMSFYILLGKDFRGNWRPSGRLPK